MPDLSQFNLQTLFRELVGQRLQDFCGRHCYKEQADYEAQTPSLHPLGQLKHAGPDGGRGMGQQWMTLDETVTVKIEPNGVVKWVSEAR